MGSTGRRGLVKEIQVLIVKINQIIKRADWPASPPMGNRPEVELLRFFDLSIDCGAAFCINCLQHPASSRETSCSIARLITHSFNMYGVLCYLNKKVID